MVVEEIRTDTEMGGIQPEVRGCQQPLQVGRGKQVHHWNLQKESVKCYFTWQKGLKDVVKVTVDLMVGR